MGGSSQQARGSPCPAGPCSLSRPSRRCHAPLSHRLLDRPPHYLGTQRNPCRFSRVSRVRQFFRTPKDMSRLSEARRLDDLALKRHDVILRNVRTVRRATVCLDATLHCALRLKAAGTDWTVSDLVNEAGRQTLAEDADDLAAFEARAKEPNLDFESVLKDLRRRGKL